MLETRDLLSHTVLIIQMQISQYQLVKMTKSSTKKRSTISKRKSRRKQRKKSKTSNSTLESKSSQKLTHTLRSLTLQANGQSRAVIWHPSMQRALHQRTRTIDTRCRTADPSTRNSHFRPANSRTHLQTRSLKQLSRAHSSPKLRTLRVQFSSIVGQLCSLSDNT